MHDIFYFTDIHGMYDLYRAIMDYCLKQDPEATIVFGGDACDRGPDGYKIIKELLDNPQVVYIKGNHEDMFVRAADVIHKAFHDECTLQKIEDFLYICSSYDEGSIEIQDVICNGGWSTLRDWMLEGMPMDIINRLRNLPLTTQYKDLDFCHAGGDPKVYTRVTANEYDKIPVNAEDADHVLWDRNWLGFGWIPERTCIFGHTPVTHLPAKYYGRDKSRMRAHPCKYVGMVDERLTGARFCMDTGACLSGRAYVLNCLTMKAIGFKDNDVENEEIRKHDIEQFDVIQF